MHQMLMAAQARGFVQTRGSRVPEDACRPAVMWSVLLSSPTPASHRVLFLVAAALMLTSEVAAQPPVEQRLFVQADVVVPIRPVTFHETESTGGQIGSPHRPGPRLTVGLKMTPRSSLRVEYERPGSQIRTSTASAAPTGIRPPEDTSRTSVLAFLLGFHPAAPARPTLGFLMGVGVNRNANLSYDWYSGRRRTWGRTDTVAAIVLGAEAGWPIGGHFDLVGSARLNLPFGSNRVIVRAGAGLRWSF